MELSPGRNLLIDRVGKGVCVVRFTRPDLRAQLDGVGAEDCELYRDFQAAVLDHVASNDMVLLNFGLVLYFPTAFYQVLLQLKHALQAKQARLALCGLGAEVQETMHVMAAEKVFAITHTEEHAIRQATH
jgi:anti-anti-sigma regulatory factor